jgi:phosphoribosylaminoimidazole-succinocarboxamide synthase
MGKEGQSVPEMSDEWLEQISARYIELYEQVTGKKFERQDYTHAESRMEDAVLSFLASKS